MRVCLLCVGILSLSIASLPEPAEACLPSPDDAGCPPDPGPGNAIEDLAGCTVNSLPPNDDGSSGPVPIGFTGNFFGNVLSEVWINNNGNVTLDGPMSTWTPFSLAGTARQIIAPYFADVDTRNTGSDVVTYGAVTFASRPGFCVNWAGVGVGYYDQHIDKLNNFQLLLVDRSDTGPGNFDIYFNYDNIDWEAGDASGGTNGLGGTSARAGYSNGAGSALELPGSGVPGSFLDSNPAGLIYRNRASTRAGRYYFMVREGLAPSGSTVSGTILDPNGIGAVAAPVQACMGTSCLLTQTDAAGAYDIVGLENGTWTVEAFPPSGTNWLSALSAPFVIFDSSQVVNLSLGAPAVIPDGTTLVPSWKAGGVENVYWHDQLILTIDGCTGGTASYMLVNMGSTIRSGPMDEGPIGHYSATVAPLYPNHGDATFTMTLTCPDATSTVASFDIYIDPSGHVLTVCGDPIEGATVVLFRSDAESGPFTGVPQGSALMSPTNRTNPDATDAEGRFGWDVVSGYYFVTAARAGCTSPDGEAQVSTEILSIPPAVTDLDLRLDCPDIDSSPPVITFPGDILAQATSGAGASVAYSVSAVDCVEGPVGVSCDPASGSVFAPGFTQVDCSSSDGAGNTANGSFGISVQYAWTGVLQPINADGSSIFKLGRTVPVKFNLSGANGFISNATARLFVRKLSNSVIGTQIEAESTSAATTGNLFQHTGSGQYLFNWGTSSLSAGTWELTIDLGDGNPHTVIVSLRP